MAIRDIFKKKKKEKRKKEKIKGEVKPEVEEKKPPEEVLPKVKVREKRVGEAYRVLEALHITEKATGLTKQNQYVFKVFPEANKVEIKKAIEDLYGVDVISVKIIKVPPRRRRLGRISGWRKGYKKAIVKIKEGQKIEVLPR